MHEETHLFPRVAFVYSRIRLKWGLTHTERQKKTGKFFRATLTKNPRHQKLIIIILGH